MKDLFTKNTNYVDSDVEYFQTVFGLNLDLARLFSSRGVTIDNAERYFNFDENNFHNPFLMKNMPEAVEIIKQVMADGGKILIYGDYDADGLTASSILKLFFNNNGTYCDIIIPTRDEGYGMHIENVYDAFSRVKYDLIITVDCGISNKEEIAVLKKTLDTQIIVTDHHEIPSEIPDCVCVNPKLGYPFASLAGAGVAWKLIQAVGGYKQSKNYVDLAAVGTIADMMPLIDDNRDLVKLGLSQFKHKGLNKLAQLSNCSKPFTACDIALRIAPKINAAGRLGDPLLALQVLLMQDDVDEDVIARLLSINNDRRSLVDEIVKSAEEKLDNKEIAELGLIYLYDDEWKNGVLGIAANRFKEAYGVPSVFLTRDGENYVGSARGVENVNLFSLFESVSDVLVKFGGHKASVGFTVSEKNVDELKKRLSENLKTVANDEIDCSVCYYDLEFDAKYLVKENFYQLEILQPTLPNDKVTFHVKDFCKIAALFGSDRNHLKIQLNNGLEMKGFYRFTDYFDALSFGAECEILFNLEYDSYSKRVVGIINNIKLLNSLHFDEIYAQNIIKRLCENNADDLRDKDVKRLLTQNSTLVVFATDEAYQIASEKYDFSDFRLFYFALNGYVNRAAVISPISEEMFSRYANVIAFGGFNGFLPRYSADYIVYQIDGLYPPCLNFRLDRGICATVYKALRTNVVAVDIKSLYYKLRLADISYTQFLAAVKVFEELKLLKFFEPFGYEILNAEKTELSASHFFNLFNKVDK